MGVSTVIIGMLPTYQHHRIAAPLLSRCAAFGQGLGLGGEWGARCCSRLKRAAANAPGTGCFRSSARQSGSFFRRNLPAVSEFLSDAQFFAFGWRIPFLASAALVAVGLYVR
jgi:hypothetical protein